MRSVRLGKSEDPKVAGPLLLEATHSQVNHLDILLGIVIVCPCMPLHKPGLVDLGRRAQTGPPDVLGRGRAAAHAVEPRADGRAHLVEIARLRRLRRDLLHATRRAGRGRGASARGEGTLGTRTARSSQEAAPRPLPAARRAPRTGSGRARTLFWCEALSFEVRKLIVLMLATLDVRE